MSVYQLEGLMDHYRIRRLSLSIRNEILPFENYKLKIYDSKIAN